MENYFREIAAKQPKTNNVLKNVQNKISRKNYTNIKSLIETIERLPIKYTEKNNLYKQINAEIPIPILQKLIYLRRLGKVNASTITKSELNHIIEKIEKLGLEENKNIKSKLNKIKLNMHNRMVRKGLNKVLFVYN